MKTALLVLALAVAALAAPSVDPSLFSSLKTKGRTTVIVSFKGSKVAEIRSRATARSYTDRTARLNGLYSALKAHADETQANVLAGLKKSKDASGAKLRQLWINNKLIVRDADILTVKQLMSFPEVASIEEERWLPLETPAETVIHPEGYAPKAGEQWGVALIDAPAVWASGNQGEGVVVANVDTGVRVTHVALKDNYRADYGWYDPYQNTDAPNDQNGHGTHTMGTIAGRANGIGVAPGSTWIACKGCSSSSCSTSALLECGQWIACPTDTDGNNPDCSKAPQISSNSWGGGQGDDFYDDVLILWESLGIAPLFSQGNSGPYCGSASSPGDSIFAIGVGSTTSSDEISSFSSVGPTYRGRRIKPDISAPGSNVVSAYYTSDTAYATLSGTSMACPHAAGLSALLYSAKPNLTIPELRAALAAGGQPIKSTGQNCGGISESVYPNNIAGAGRISAPASLGSI